MEYAPIPAKLHKRFLDIDSAGYHSRLNGNDFESLPAKFQEIGGVQNLIDCGFEDEPDFVQANSKKKKVISGAGLKGFISLAGKFANDKSVEDKLRLLFRIWCKCAGMGSYSHGGYDTSSTGKFDLTSL